MVGAPPSYHSSSAALIGWMLALPAVIVTAFTLSVVLGERAGFEPLSYGRPISLAEAAARANLSELARLSASGADSHRVYPMRSSYTDFGISAATLAEAAVLSKNVAVVQYVERFGLPDDADSRASLLCLSRDIGADDVTKYLAAHIADSRCAPGAAIGALRARTAG
jgi:hypothetical protein